MRRTLAFLAGAFVAGAVFVLTGPLQPGREVSADQADDAPRPGGPILVELFTSQGCSSCPPADQLLPELDSLAGPGVEVVALAFHVDYWNRLGWRDPFSSVEWSMRQSRYAQAFGSSRVYTPQLVVDGRFETVGSDRRAVLDLVERAASTPRPAQLELSARRSGDRLVADVEATGDAPGALYLAVVESDLSTEVTRGENAHRTLGNHHVVRRLELLGASGNGPEGTARSTAEIPLDPAWRPGHLALVAFLQDPESLEIRAVARVRLTAG